MRLTTRRLRTCRGKSPAAEHRQALIARGWLDGDHLERRRRRVDEAHDPPAANLPRKESRRRDEKRDPDVLVVHVKRVPVVAFVLAEGFSMIP